MARTRAERTGGMPDPALGGALGAASALDEERQRSHVLAALDVADELAACREVSGMLQRAIELGRTRLGLERVGLFIRDRGSERILLRGTWGTGARGETTDERALFHELPAREYDVLIEARRSGNFGQYRADSPLFALQDGRAVVLGRGWVMATPLIAARDLVGMMYNDTAFTHRPVDEGRQAAAAVLCTTLALLYQTRRGAINWQPPPYNRSQSPLVARVLRALAEDLSITGDRIAAELGVSPGYLSRSFRREMGLSLVDYRNRMRLDRFLQIVQRCGINGNLLGAALEAGFGSYAQFHRVYRSCLGTSPRETFSSVGLSPGERELVHSEMAQRRVRRLGGSDRG